MYPLFPCFKHHSSLPQPYSPTRLLMANTDLVAGWMPSSVPSFCLRIQDITITHNYSKTRVVASRRGWGVCAFSRYEGDVINILSVAFVAKAINVNQKYVPHCTIGSAFLCPKKRLCRLLCLAFALDSQVSWITWRLFSTFYYSFVYWTNALAPSAFVLKYTELHLVSQNTAYSCVLPWKHFAKEWSELEPCVWEHGAQDTFSFRYRWRVFLFSQSAYNILLRTSVFNRSLKKTRFQYSWLISEIFVELAAVLFFP